MKYYTVEYDTKENRTEYHHSETITAENAKKAKEEFNSQYIASGKKAHPFHVTIRPDKTKG